MRFRTLLKCYRHIIVVLLSLGGIQAGYGQCDFTFGSNVNGCAPLVVLASAVAPASGIPYTNYTWILNGPAGFVRDSTSGGNNSFSRGLSIPGNYCLTLRTKDANGDTCSITKCNITVAAKPTVNITFSQTTGCSPLSTFVQCNTTAGCGTIDSFVIDWGCGQIYNGTSCPANGINKVYTCPPGNCYSPTVIVKNSCGCYKDSTYNGLICIINKPIANFTADTMTANCASGPLTSHFTATDAGPGMTYKWYVDNGLIQSNASTLFTYTFPVRPQCYDVKLVVQHFSGAVCVDSSTKQVCVRAQPVINYFKNINTACVNATHPATLVLTVDTTIGLNSLSWQLSGPQSFTNTTGKTATYNITTPGTYTATGTGTFGPGCSNSLTQQVLVANLRPTAAFTISDTFACSLPFDPVVTATSCTGCTYAWNISGNSPPNFTGQNATPHYTSFRCSNIQLIVTDGNGCKDTTLRNNAICTKRISPVIGLSGSKGCAPLCVNFTNNTVLTNFPDPISNVCWSFPGSAISGACQPSISKCFTNVGCNSVRLVLTTNGGCVDSVTLVDSICVGSPPVCTATASPSSMCYGDTVNFSMTCDSFDFIKCIYGDGITDVLHSSIWQHVFQDTGFFNTLIIPYNDSCVGDTVHLSFTIHPPIAIFSKLSSCNTADTVFLQNQSKGATSYLWQFCDGTTSTLANPFKILPYCDTCTVSLTAYNSVFNCSNTASQLINTSCNVSSFYPLDTFGCLPFTSRFYNTSLNHNNSFTRWDWSTPPVTWGPFAGDTINHTFSTAGVYTIAMRNESSGGCIDTVYGTVRVCQLTANFGPTSVCLPLPLCFQNLTIDTPCAATSWFWDFGDGTTDTVANPCHVYSTPGVYRAKLVVRNGYGCVDSISKNITAATPVNLNYNIDTIICPGNQECVTNNSTGIALTFGWKIPGALPTDTFTANAPCFRFAAPGDYPVYLKITSGNQCTVFDTVTIHNQYPVASGYASIDTLLCPQPPTAIKFINTSQYVDSLVFWGFGDSSVAFGDTVFNYYTKAGTYYVTMIVLDKQGCSDTAIIDTIVVKGPYGDFGLNPIGMCSCKDTIHFTINTVEASTLTLIYGCNLGFSQQAVSPIGTAGNPSQLTFDWSYCIADSCQPQLLFGDTAGCQVLYDQFFIPIDSPDVKFAFDNYGVCVNGTVCFFDSTTYHLAPYHSFTVKRIWDFGDGTIDSTSNNPNPCHYYGQIGGYAAKLYIYSNLGCFDSSVTTVVVVPSYPEAGFYADDSLVCANSPICFHDTSSIYYLTGADYWVWDFGDSLNVRDTSYTPDFCHIFRTGGYYRVHMCVYDSVGCADCDSSVVIRVIDNPTANAGGDRNICYGVVTQLNGSGGTTPLWDPAGLVSDPNIYNPTIQIFNDTTIMLMVGDQYGCRDTDTAILSVSQVFAEFNVGPLFCQGDSVCVTDASTNVNGTLSMWIYDFATGDSINAGSDVCYNYPVFGTYGIQLTAIDDNGCWDTITHPVDILPSPNAIFSLNDTVICSDQQLCVTDLSTSNSAAPITSWTWNYGASGNSVTGQTQPCHTYNPPYQPTYPVSLVAKDQNGCVDTSIIVITLNEIPRANFSWSVACETDLMPLVSLSAPGDGAIVGCEWLLWVGAPSPTIANNCNTSFQFPAGSYPVQLVVTDINGCTDTIIKTVKSDSLSQLEIYPGDTTICLGDAVQYTVSGVFDQIVWQPSVWVDNPYSPVVTIQPEGNISYIVSATNGVCTAASDTFSIRTLQPVPITVEAVPQQVVLGLSSSISSQIPGRIDSVIWSPDLTLDCRECPNPVALPTQTTTYTATIYYSENGTTCTNSDSVTIEVLKVCDNSVIYIPNTFTPNGDGLNDVFMIRGLAATKINNFRVFDRWGKLVFEATKGEPNEPRWGWDGNDASGKKLNAAVYVYTYEIECINGDIVTGKGNITLIR